MEAEETEFATVATDGPFLRQHRELAGLTLTEVAAAAGISKGYLSKLETGKAHLDHARVMQIADGIAAAFGARRGAA